METFGRYVKPGPWIERMSDGDEVVKYGLQLMDEGDWL